MFGWLFRKRKTERRPSSIAPQDETRRAKGSAGSLTNVIVRRSAANRLCSPDEGYDIVQAVVDFVNDVMDETPYTRSEMPAKAMQAYHADFYLAQVNNGGHSQFIHNSGDNLPNVIADARAGLAGMKADEHLAILERMAEWLRNNPAEVSKQTGFKGGRAPLLDELDTLFYQTDKANPMINLSADWIHSWPELRIVEDAEYSEAIHGTAAMNPLREARLVQRSIADINHQVTDWFHVGVGLACTAASEIKLTVGGGVPMEIEGERQWAFSLRTNAGTRFYVVTDHYAAIYERTEADNPPMPDFRNAQAVTEAFADGLIDNYKLPTIGARLSHVQRKSIEDVIEFAVKYKSGAAIDILMRRAGLEPADAAVSPVPIKPGKDGMMLNCLIAAGDQVLFVTCTPRGGAIMDAANDKTLAMVRSLEVDEHAARAEAAFPDSAKLG